MAADSDPVDYGILRYIPRSTLDSMSGSAYAAYFASNGTLLGIGESGGKIHDDYCFYGAVNTPDRVVHFVCYQSSRYYTVKCGVIDDSPLSYATVNTISDSKIIRGPQYQNVSSFSRYGDIYTFDMYLNRSDWSFQPGIFRLYTSEAEAYEALANSFSASPPDPGPGGDGLFVASVYNSSPFVVSDSFLSSSGSSLDGSYNIDDAVYTPVVEHEGTAFSSGLSVKPRSSVAQYLLWENQSYSSADYSAITLSGTYTFYAQADLTTASGTTSKYIYPSSMQLAVNGEPVYFSNVNYQGNGVLSFDGCTLRLSDFGGQIYSIGVLANYSGSIREVAVLSDWSVGFFGASDLTVSTAEATTPTYPEDPTVGDVLPGLDGVQNAVESSNRKIDNILQMLINLPQNIANLIGGLFIPQNLDSYYDSYTQLLESKLGFVWQSGSLIADFFATFVGYFSSGVAPYDFLFGPVVVPMGGESYTIVEQTAVSLDNDFLDVIRPILDSIVMLVCTLAVANVGRDMLVSIISGASYMDFLNRKGSGE